MISSLRSSTGSGSEELSGDRVAQWAVGRPADVATGVFETGEQASNTPAPDICQGLPAVPVRM